MKLSDLPRALAELEKAARLRVPDDRVERQELQRKFGDRFIDAASNDYLDLAMGADAPLPVSRETADLKQDALGGTALREATRDSEAVGAEGSPRRDSSRGAEIAAIGREFVERSALEASSLFERTPEEGCSGAIEEGSPSSDVSRGTFSPATDSVGVSYFPHEDKQATEQARAAGPTNSARQMGRAVPRGSETSDELQVEAASRSKEEGSDAQLANSPPAAQSSTPLRRTAASNPITSPDEHALASNTPPSTSPNLAAATSSSSRWNDSVSATSAEGAQGGLVARLGVPVSPDCFDEPSDGRVAGTGASSPDSLSTLGGSSSGKTPDSGASGVPASDSSIDSDQWENATAGSASAKASTFASSTFSVGHAGGTSADESDARATFESQFVPKPPSPSPVSRETGVQGKEDQTALFSSPQQSQSRLQAPPVGAGSSRLIFGSSPEHVLLEQELAAWVGLPASLLFASGYAANVGALGAILSPEDAVFSDSLNHASLIDGIRLSRARAQVVPHLDLEELEEGLAQNLSAPARWVICEAYYSMDGDGPDLAALRALCDRYDAQLYVDEAHSLGTFGPQGAGLCAAQGVVPDVLMAAFGKSVGSQGACVAGSTELRTWLWNRARSFVFSTAPSPLLVAATRQQFRRTQAADRARSRLESVCLQVRGALRETGIPLVAGSFGPVVGLLMGAEERALLLAQRLRESGILAQAVRPPTVPVGASRVRLVLRASLTDDQIARLVEVVARETTS